MKSLRTRIGLALTLGVVAVASSGCYYAEAFAW